MWDKIKMAIQSIIDDKANRIDGEGWSVYAVGSNVIRIDLKPGDMPYLDLEAEDQVMG